MFTRHLKKFNNTAEMEAAIRDGLVASPYVIFNADRNTANMVLPDGKEAADIEYEPWLSPYLVSNMYTADPSNGIYTDPSGNFEIGYAEDDREGWKYVESLFFYLNSQYLEGWGSTAETIDTDTAAGSNTPYVFITEKGPLDAVVEYQENTYGFSESRTLAELVYNAVNEVRELSYDGATTCTWRVALNDGTETSFWGEDIEYLSDVQSLEGHYMQTNNDEGRIPEYYILVAYQKEDEPLKASNENILRAPVDYESMYKVYKAGIFRAYDYSEEEPVVPSEDPTLTFNYTDVTYNTVADFVPAIYGDTSYYDSVAFFIVDQSTIDDILIEHGGWSHGDALWSLIESDEASVIADASAGDTVSLASSLNAYYDSQNVYVFALLEHFENAVRDFYQPNATDDNYAYETVQWAEAEEPTTTYFTMNINSHAFDPNDSSTYDVNVEFSGYPGDLTWPYVTFGAYKVTEMTPYGDVTAMSNVLGQNYDYFPAGGSGTHTIEITIDLQPGESAYYCVCGAPMNDMPSTEMMYVAYQQVLVTVPSEGGDSSTWYEEINFASAGDESHFYTDNTVDLSQDDPRELWSPDETTDMWEAMNHNGEVAMVVNGTYDNGYLAGGRMITPTEYPLPEGASGLPYLVFEDCSVGFGDQFYFVSHYEDSERGGDYYYISGPYEHIDEQCGRVDVIGYTANYNDYDGTYGSIYIENSFGPSTPIPTPETNWYNNVQLMPPAGCQDWTADETYADDENDFLSQIMSIEDTYTVENAINYMADPENYSFGDLELVVGATWANGRLTGGRRVPATLKESNTIEFANANISANDSAYIVIDAGGEEFASWDETETFISHNYTINGGEIAGEDIANLRISTYRPTDEWGNEQQPVVTAESFTFWYEDVDWSSEDEYDENEQKVVDYTRIVSDASMSVEENLYDVYVSNWEKMYSAAEDYDINLIVNPTVDSSDGLYLIGGRPVIGIPNYDDNTFSIQFNDCSIGENDTFYIASYNNDGRKDNYVLIGPLTGESVDSIEVEWNDEAVQSNGPDSVVVTPMSDTPDVSLGYKFSIGTNNGGYFNTGYVPGADTVVQLKGKIINDGASAHGIKGDYNDWMYRIFGNEGDVYFDRMDDQVRITAAVNDIENTSHEYEFGNYYIKVDGVTEATDSESDLSNFHTEISLLVFATSQIGAMGETILDTLAAPGTEVEYFKILEPDGNGGLNLEKDLRPALDASGNVCMYDQVAGDIIYPEGSSVNIIATAISGDEPGPDSSTSSTDIIAVHGNPGPTPSTENPFVTLVVDASIDALSSWDHMEVGIYSLNHYENNGYSSINAYRLGGFIKTCTIALTNGTAHYSIQSADDLDCSEIPAGDGYTFTGYDDTICVVAWFIREYGAGYTDDEIFELYEYELPSSSGGDSSILVPANPAVEYANYSDDGEGTITFDAWLNADAIAAGAHHYSVGLTSDAMKQTAMEEAMMNSEEWDPDAWMVSQCYGTYSGDSAAPNSITLGYSTTFDDLGEVIAVMYDSGDSIVQYNGADFQTIDGWSFTVPPEEPPMEPPMEEPIE